MSLMFTQEPDKWPHLMRLWGADQDALMARFGLRENDGGVVAVWFPSYAARESFKEAISDLRNLVRDASDGDEADTSSITGAEVWLRTPDCRTFTYRDSFGYGYPPHSVVFMYTEGNYSCDCNRTLFIAQHCDPTFEDTERCGETIQLVRLRVYQVRPDGSEVTVEDISEPESA